MCLGMCAHVFSSLSRTSESSLPSIFDLSMNFNSQLSSLLSILFFSVFLFYISLEVAMEYNLLRGWDPKSAKHQALMKLHLHGNGAAKTPTIPEDLKMIKDAGFIVSSGGFNGGWLVMFSIVVCDCGLFFRV